MTPQQQNILEYYRNNTEEVESVIQEYLVSIRSKNQEHSKATEIQGVKELCTKLKAERLYSENLAPVDLMLSLIRIIKTQNDAIL